MRSSTSSLLNLSYHIRTARRALLAGLMLGLALAPEPAAANNNEPPACLSMDPSQWPAPAKPYFLIIVDTSSSMGFPIPFPIVSPCPGSGCPAPVECPAYPGNRNGHLRCALDQTLATFSGQVNFGLAGMALQPSGCPSACVCNFAGPPYTCFNGCTYTPYPGDVTGGCGPGTTPATRQGLNLLAPLVQDHFWSNPPAATNAAQIVGYLNNDCTGSIELWATGKTPINGVLQDAIRYFSNTYVIPGTATAVPTPLDPTNERSCRSVNVILIVAGDENCDTYTDATAAAATLYNGIAVGNVTWNIRTHVVALVGGANGAVIAGAGASSTQTGTVAGHGYYAHPTNSTALIQTLANIVGSAIQPETCDNVDNNCNGCTDEGLTHYCDQSQPCCVNSTPAQRSACLASYQASITPASPHGDPALLPCTTAGAATTPSTWLCYDPGDQCDNIDNNCDGSVDERQKKCGFPLHCPQAEVCNGLDDNCDGVVDNGGICASCTPKVEVCDGCDNDCNGSADNPPAGGFPVLPCGVPSPPHCVGTRTCLPPQFVSAGACSASGGYSTCNNVVLAETCNGLDDDCDGIIDDNIPSVSCVPNGFPPGLVYNDGVNHLTSQCRQGSTQCTSGQTVCSGAIGPSAEICDGIDNDCDGLVDNNVVDAHGHHQGDACCRFGGRCGRGVCTAGTWTCGADALVCTGGVGPATEICNGLDDDCNGVVDDVPGVGAPCALSPGIVGAMRCDLGSHTLTCRAR